MTISLIMDPLKGLNCTVQKNRKSFGKMILSLSCAQSPWVEKRRGIGQWCMYCELLPSGGKNKITSENEKKENTTQNQHLGDIHKIKI